MANDCELRNMLSHRHIHVVHVTHHALHLAA